MVSVLFLPLAVIQVGSEFYTFNATGVMTMGAEPELVYPTWALVALTGISALIGWVTIFLYKRRMLQIRLSVFNAILMIGFYAVFGFFVYSMKDGLGEASSFSLKIGLCLPLIALILDYLAIRNIGADEMLVRSLNRLR